MSSAPVFPYPGGVAGEEPPDPTAGAPGHFAWSRWIKQFVKNLDAQKVAKGGDTMTGDLTIDGPNIVDAVNFGADVAILGRTTDNIALIMNKAFNTFRRLKIASPTEPDDAATKDYVDQSAAQNPKHANPIWLPNSGNFAVMSNPGQSIGLTWNAPWIQCQVDISDVGTFAWNSGSSRTIKHDIEPLTLSDLFDRISPMEFRYNEDAPVPPDEDKTALRRGFIAEDVAAAGVATKVDADGNPTGLCDADLIAILWAKVQELSAKVAVLESRA